MKALIIFLLVSKGVSAQQAIVTGAVPQNLAGRSITLTLINYETRNDSVVQESQIGQDGKFILTISLKEPEIYDLGVDNSSLVQVLAKPGDKIDLKIGKDHIEVTGSIETQYLIDYEANRKVVFNKYLKTDPTIPRRRFWLKAVTKKGSNIGMWSMNGLPKIIRPNWRNGWNSPFLSIRLPQCIIVYVGIRKRTRRS